QRSRGWAFFRQWIKCVSTVLCWLMSQLTRCKHQAFFINLLYIKLCYLVKQGADAHFCYLPLLGSHLNTMVVCLHVERTNPCRAARCERLTCSITPGSRCGTTLMKH